MKYSKSLLITAGLLLVTTLGTSCTSSGPSTKRGSVAGGITGAVLGSIVGNQSGRPLEGAAIGGIIGSAAGATLGSAQDQDNKNITSNKYYKPSPPVINHSYHYHTKVSGPPRRYWVPAPQRRYWVPAPRSSIHLHYHK